jgi:hypothetical protein
MISSGSHRGALRLWLGVGLVSHLKRAVAMSRPYRRCAALPCLPRCPRSSTSSAFVLGDQGSVNLTAAARHAIRVEKSPMTCPDGACVHPRHEPRRRARQLRSVPVEHQPVGLHLFNRVHAGRSDLLWRSPCGLGESVSRDKRHSSVPQPLYQTCALDGGALVPGPSSTSESRCGSRTRGLALLELLRRES